MNYDHKTPWELVEYLEDAHLAYWRGSAKDYQAQSTQIQLWNNSYSNALMANADTIRWATEMTRFIRYPNTDPLLWNHLQAELHWMSLEGVAGTTGALRPAMLLSTALICYTDLYKNLNTQKICRDAMRQLRKYGIDIQWSLNSVDEDDAIFDVPSRTSRRAVFGKGAIPILRRVAPVMKNCRTALLPIDRAPDKNDFRDMAEEAIFELNAFAEQNGMTWRATLRQDWESLCLAA